MSPPVPVPAPAPADAPLSLFAGYGIELEYMIVDAHTLDVRPITDQLFQALTGRLTSDVEAGPIEYSNELVLHVVELKTAGPAPRLEPLSARFAEHVGRINAALANFGARLLPTAMHPWMDPHREMRLWPHESSPIYEAFNRIFDCRGHGWANLQSMHLNLPFADDAEFGRLHAAIRLLLPLLPALAASSPVMDGRPTGLMDSRLEVYRRNSQRIPSVAARVIPEQAWSRAEYQRLILEPMYAEIAPLDPEGLLQDEFLNARGAIARFSRQAIEIRVIDVQECPRADLAIASLVVAALQLLVGGQWTDATSQQAVENGPLEALLLAAIRDADAAVVDEPAILRQFGITVPSRISLRDLWLHVLETAARITPDLVEPARPPLDAILAHGPLARRLSNGLGEAPPREQLRETYAELADCLAANRMFGSSS